MASITINTVEVSARSASSLTGGEQLLVTTKDGSSSTLTVNQILDYVDDPIIESVGKSAIEAVEEKIDEKIAEGLKDIDPNNNLTWNDEYDN